MGGLEGGRHTQPSHRCRRTLHRRACTRCAHTHAAWAHAQLRAHTRGPGLARTSLAWARAQVHAHRCSHTGAHTRAHTHTQCTRTPAHTRTPTQSRRPALHPTTSPRSPPVPLAEAAGERRSPQRPVSPGRRNVPASAAAALSPAGPGTGRAVPPGPAAAASQRTERAPERLARRAGCHRQREGCEADFGKGWGFPGGSGNAADSGFSLPLLRSREEASSQLPLP